MGQRDVDRGRRPDVADGSVVRDLPHSDMRDHGHAEFQTQGRTCTMFVPNFPSTASHVGGTVACTVGNHAALGMMKPKALGWCFC